MTVTLYCKSHKRRPIRLGYPVFFRDAQADIPPAWCDCCGCEVFELGERQCRLCRGMKGDVYE